MSWPQKDPQFSSNFRAISCAKTITVDVEKSENMLKTSNTPFTVLGWEGCVKWNSVGPTGKIPCNGICFINVQRTIDRPHGEVKSIQNLAGAGGILKKVIDVATYNGGNTVSPWVDDREVCINDLDP